MSPKTRKRICCYPGWQSNVLPNPKAFSHSIGNVTCFSPIFCQKTLILQVYVCCTKKVLTHVQVCLCSNLLSKLYKLVNEEKLLLSSQDVTCKIKVFSKNRSKGVFDTWNDDLTQSFSTSQEEWNLSGSTKKNFFIVSNSTTANVTSKQKIERKLLSRR